jgi:aminoglycoside phosphotransferase (APT) family kinase protein
MAPSWIETILSSNDPMTVDIDAALATMLIAVQFPHWAGLAITPVEPGGNDNRTFRLGTQMSLRLPSAEGYSSQVEREQRWLPVLAPLLPLAVPIPVAKGRPGAGYPWSWTVNRWLEGEVASTGRIDDLNEFATSLAHFLTSLRQIDPAGGPPPGPGNFFRGGPLETYDGETRSAIASLKDRNLAEQATAVWDGALSANWLGSPVWFHGEMSETNLLVRDGQLSAVIDFGCAGVGDPACDVTIAWTMFAGESRRAFRTAVGVDDATWQRGRGWALWKGLITLVAHADTNPGEAAKAARVVAAVLADHE